MELTATYVSCDSFDITNAKPATCKRGDFFLINGEKFCDDNAPDIIVDSAKLKVMFKSHKKIGGGPGAECNIQCLAPTTTETPTGAPSTTTTSPGVTTTATNATITETTITTTTLTTTTT